MTVQANLTIRDNADYVKPLAWVDQNRSVYDWTGCTFAMDIRTSADAVSATLALTTANGGIASTDLANSTITINIGPGDIVPGAYVYDLVKIDAGSVRETLMFGTATVVDGVTA